MYGCVCIECVCIDCACVWVCSLCLCVCVFGYVWLVKCALSACVWVCLYWVCLYWLCLCVSMFIVLVFLCVWVSLVLSVCKCALSACVWVCWYWVCLCVSVCVDFFGLTYYCQPTCFRQHILSAYLKASYWKNVKPIERIQQLSARNFVMGNKPTSDMAGVCSI